MNSMNYTQARDRYAELGVDTDAAIETARSIPISVHCWQGDDLTGFISGVDELSDGGIMATGNFPGKAKNGRQLRADLELALKFIPGKKKVNLYSVYAEAEGKLDLSEITVDHFGKWIAWARARGCGLDFNPTCFSHPMLKDGYTLASKDPTVRRFWIEHVKNTRRISEQFGKSLGTVCVHNIWLPDGQKDTTIDRIGHRRLLMESLDEVLAEPCDQKYVADSVESKLFGVGSESFVAGSHEFYLLYALTRGIVPCMDMGHFHPTESVADKISSLLLFFDRLQIHTSRGVRWDSDHVVILSDEVLALMAEIKRCKAYDRVMIALDYFDGSINRIMAWAVGARSTRKAILLSLLEPQKLLLEAEETGNFGRRLALLEELKTYPAEAVWTELCERENVDPGISWIAEAERYEREVLLGR